MKKQIYVYLILSLLPLNLCAQSEIAGEIGINRLKELYVVNMSRQASRMSVADIYTIGNNWHTVASKLSISAAECKNQASGNWCYYKPQGLDAAFTDYLGDYNFSHLNITDRSFSLEVDGVKVKPGDSISSLSSLFSEAYQKRSKIPGADSEGYQVLLHLKDTELSISFVYDSNNQKISSIEIHHSLF